MGRFFTLALTLILSTTALAEDVLEEEEHYCKTPGYVSRDTTVLSMMGWGVGLFAAIAVLTSLLGNNPDKDGTTTTTTTP